MTEDVRVSLTVQQLVDIPSLRTRFLAGTSGGGRPVLWAHTCELPDPWNWLGTGDLLMSDGYGFPPGAQEQVDFLRSCAAADLSGLALAEGLHAAPLTATASAAADELCFPVLETEYAVPFVTVARTVADSNSRDAGLRLTKILRVYDTLRRSQQPGYRHGSLLPQLEAECGAVLHVLDTRDANVLLGSRARLGTDTRAAVLEELRARTPPLPAFMRAKADGRSLLLLPLAGVDDAVLVADPQGDHVALDLVVLQHVATIAALDVERQAGQALRHRESGARLFRQLVEGTIDAEAAVARLAAAGLESRPWRVLDFGCSTSQEDVSAMLRERGVPHLLSSSSAELLVLLSDQDLDPEMRSGTRLPGVTLGLSWPVHVVARVADAVRESRWAWEAARSADVAAVVYGAQTSPFLPRTVGEGEATVVRVLGPLIDYDAAHDSRLLASLEAFLEANRSWSEAAARLGIHKQTLVYRMRRVEELTGRRVQALEDQTELYVAMRARRMLREA